MAKRSDGIKKVDDIDEKEFLSFLDGRATPSALPKKEKTEMPVEDADASKVETSREETTKNDIAEVTAEKDLQVQTQPRIEKYVNAETKNRVETEMPDEATAPVEKAEPEEREIVPKRTYKKRKNGEYIDAFMKPRVLKQRQSVYISQEIHEFIAKVVNKLSVRNMTVGIFIDTVMTQHIKDHMEELRAIYYREEGDIFKNIVNNNDDE